MLRSFVIVGAMLLSVAAHAEVHVSDFLRAPVIVETQTVAPRHRLQWKFNLHRGDKVEFKARLAPHSVRGIEGFVCPQSEFQARLKRCRRLKIGLGF